MSLLVSIFGGMLLTAVLFYLGRLARLSSFWAAVAAAALPTFAYLIYAIGQAPGLDVVTMHVIAYPTVAVLLAILNGDKVKRGPTLHWAPKILIGFFLIVVTVLASFVYIAGQGLPPALARLLLPATAGKTIHTGFAGVVEHQQEAAKGIGHHLGMENKLARLGWRVEIDGLSGLRAGAPAQVSVTIKDRSGTPVEAVAVDLALTRPGQAGVVELPLIGGNGGYHGNLAGLDSGVWVAVLRLNQDKNPIVLEHSLEVR